MKYSYLARYGAMRMIGTFASDLRMRLGDRCILRSERGTEWGEALAEPRVPEGDTTPPTLEGAILRRPTPQDYTRQREIEDVEQAKEFAFCAAQITERQLPMRLACVEHTFGGEKIIFYFLAEGRVDFRQLVKDLATEYRTRIELRQIGVRDEARLLAQYEHCGRELCCRTFMQDLEPVTMRMAKLQKTTLDPTKISGRCGRLMCCLRFEDETYADLKTKLPKKGSRVRISEGVGEVVSSEILAQTVRVELPDEHWVTVHVSEILERLPGDTESPAPRGDADERRAEPAAGAPAPDAAPRPTPRPAPRPVPQRPQARAPDATQAEPSSAAPRPSPPREEPRPAAQAPAATPQPRPGPRPPPAGPQAQVNRPRAASDRRRRPRRIQAPQPAQRPQDETPIEPDTDDHHAPQEDWVAEEWWEAPDAEPGKE